VGLELNHNGGRFFTGKRRKHDTRSEKISLRSHEKKGAKKIDGKERK